MVNDKPYDSDDFGDFNNDLEKILREFMSNIDPRAAGGAALDPQSLGHFFSFIQTGFGQVDDGAEIDWSIARKTAIQVASAGGAKGKRPDATQAFLTASLWVDEACDLSPTSDAPKALTSVEWVQSTIDSWIKLTEPVALAISDILTNTFAQQAPEALQEQLGGLSGMLRKMGGAMFAMQLGQVVGKLATEVLSGGDIGISLITKEGQQGGVLLTQNIPAFLEGLSQSETEVMLFLAVRETAHARLFRSAKWLNSHVYSIINEYAQGIEIDLEHFQDLAEEIDPNDPSSIQDLMRNGSLIPPKTDRQLVAHERLETLLALVEGWVDAVSTKATTRLPGSVAIAEMMRRRRATGGPSESAFATLIGLEMRPRKLREAAAMWNALGDELGLQARDSLWQHPDLLPTADEITDPVLLIERVKNSLAGVNMSADEFDEGLAKLLDEDSRDEDSRDEDSRDEDSRDEE